MEFTRRGGRSAFTLVEMIAVVGIVALLLAITIPGITNVWEERKHAQAVTMIRGVLMSTRAYALRTAEAGLFFYVDPGTGAQRIAPIIAGPPAPGGEFDLAKDPPELIDPPITDAMAVNRFKVAAGDIYTLPAPIRVAPRNVVDDDGGTPPMPDWPETDLAHEQGPPPLNGLGFPRHRNFFAMIFGPDGRLMVGRDVLIHDHDGLPIPDSGPRGDNKGDRTGIYVEEAEVYYLNRDEDGNGQWDDKGDIGPTGKEKLFDVIVEWTGSMSNPTNTKRAVNFPGVDGLLVYDDSILREIPADTATADGLGTNGKRGYLIREGLPIYVSRLSGEIIEGPKNE